MAGIGDDIKEVLVELGSVVTIHNIDGSTTDGGFIDSEGFPDHSTLFTRMFLRLGSVAFDTIIDNGDIIQYSSEYHLITNKVESNFENGIIENAIITYRCNVIGEFQRYTDNPTYDSDYNRVESWPQIAQNVRGCQVEKRLTEDLADYERILAVTDINDILYVSAAYDIKQADRWITSVGNKYKVESVSLFEIEGVAVIKLSDDDRG